MLFFLKIIVFRSMEDNVELQRSLSLHRVISNTILLHNISNIDEIVQNLKNSLTPIAGMAEHFNCPTSSKLLEMVIELT